MPAAPSQILADRWQLVEFLGQGAMGEVWRGRHAMLGHDAAIKLMREDAATDVELVQRFKREARIAAQLRHRNLVRVEDFGTGDDGRPFLVMELLRGESLGAFMERTGRVDRATAARVALHIAAACDTAHAAGIVHRDLKPDNCFVVTDDDGSPLVKVLDFGIAKVTDGIFKTSSGALTGLHAVLGTPMYMSPEQARGQADLDGRSDLWSLGIIVYEMLTGRLPYTAVNITQLLYAVLSAPIPPPSLFDPMLGHGIDAWFARALDRDRTHRFQSGREMVMALRSVLGVPVGPAGLTPPSLPADLSQPARTTPPRPIDTLNFAETPRVVSAYPPAPASMRPPAPPSMRPPFYGSLPPSGPPAPVSMPPTGYNVALASTAYASPSAPGLSHPGGAPYAHTRTEPIEIPPGGFVPGSSGFQRIPIVPGQTGPYRAQQAAPAPSQSRLFVLLLAIGIAAGMMFTAAIVLAKRRAHHRRVMERAAAAQVQPAAMPAP
ncbi:MAG: protein kinase, partial [Deltaproteobacteria bacterium]